jgi:hypothetical protein|tara:strand:- start:17 stop:436 length:420 start_codon:yes stop_codon:yes gene_type:complete
MIHNNLIESIKEEYQEISDFVRLNKSITKAAAIFSLATIADIATTNLSMNNYGPSEELNPFIRYIYEESGEIGCSFVKNTISNTAIGLAIYANRITDSLNKWKESGTTALSAGTVLYTYAAAHNLQRAYHKGYFENLFG